MAVNFSSDGEYIDIRSPSNIDLLDDAVGAMLAVFKCGAVGTDSQFMFAVGSAFDNIVYLRLDGSGDGAPGEAVAVWRTPNGIVTLKSGTRYDDGAFHWAYLRRPSSDTFELYVDNTLEASETNANVGTVNVTPTGRLGGWIDGTSPLDGDLARSAVWEGAAPTASDIQSFIDDPTQVPSEASLAAHYELWEGGADWSNNGWHGDGNGAPTIADHPPTSFMGRYDPMWSRTTAIMDDAAFDVATDSQGVVHAVGHRGGDLVHRKSTDGGQTWGTETVIDAGTTYYAMQYGGLYAGGGVLHFLTAEGDMGGSKQHLHYWRSEDKGTTWTGPTQITAAGEEGRRANIFEENGRIMVFSGTGSPGGGDAYFFYSDDEGATWSGGQIDSNGGTGWGTAHGDVVHLIYADTDAAQRKSFYVRSTDKGETFESRVNLRENNNSDSQLRGRVAVDEAGTVVFAWEFRPGGSETNMEIRGKRSTDGGDTISSGFSIFPDAGDDNNGHLELRAHKNLMVCVQANEDPQQVPENAIEYKYSLDGGVTWQGWEVALNRVGEADVLGGLALSDDTVHVLNTAAGTLPQYARRSLSDIAVAPQRRSVTLLNA